MCFNISIHQIVSIRAGDAFIINGHFKFVHVIDLDECREIFFHLKAEVNEAENEDKYLILKNKKSRRNRRKTKRLRRKKVTKSYKLVGLGMEMGS